MYFKNKKSQNRISCEIEEISSQIPNEELRLTGCAASWLKLSYFGFNCHNMGHTFIIFAYF